MQPGRYAQSQEDSSAAALYERHAALIFAYLRLHLPTLEDAEDVLLEVFLAALEWKPLYSLPLVDQLAWLREVAQHKLADYYRRAARRPTIRLEHLEALLEADTALTPEQQALRQEERHRLGQALQQLQPHQRQVLYLRFAVGLRCAEIGLLMGRREEAVRQLLSRTLRSLRMLYGER